MAMSPLTKKAPLTGAFFFFLILSFSLHAACPVPRNLPTYQVRKVVDGDTLRLVDGRSVRLIGLNAPELARKGRSAEPYATTARQRLAGLVQASGGRVALRLGRESKDRYGRTLAHLYDNRGRNLEELLLADGLAFRIAIAPNAALNNCHAAAERSARRAGRGLWRHAPQQTPWQLRRGGFALVQGRVARVERNRGGIWLELEGPLVLRVDLKHLRQFDAAALQQLVGRRVEARGWVIDRARNGGVNTKVSRWMLPLTHNGMLEVIR
ncbi:thermonuclease family protein [Pseudomonas sp. JS3066]|jgi:endonuclease YncB( thermonuclease family)|uniref:thermonuclease family protein n=1 Tax=unclassified Pseudomonas TaxID=196821 RepID=UPI00129E3EE7|nr:MULTISPECIES: thermonuclease family protein [unclassified Pseudomonas]MDH4655092.1 thermonuclease family protein [Pseudomonas sp. BN606]MRK20392.1 thermonuclease family protein [Pseudomonas sp. JG-B]WVK92729.1 thermonuclease family protein [Pseudomonas sp. JS3066]